MIEFQSIEKLNEAFMTGAFKLTETSIGLNGKVWDLVDTSPISIVESVQGKRPMVLYASNDELLAFVWEANQRNALYPAGAIIISGKEIVINDQEQMIIEVEGDKITIRADQLVGDLVRVQFPGLSSPKELSGKVDTGATVCSLHADNYQINGPSISFKCSPLSDNIITVPLKAKHAVKSPDGGTVYRPVIELDVKINGKTITNVEFNLNDRSHMDQPVLIGQNALQAGKFYVDPTIKEQASKIDWEMLQEISIAAPMLSRDYNEEAVSAFYEFMLESDVTFKDLVHHIKRQVIESFDEEM